MSAPRAFPVGGRIEIVVDDSLQICLRTGSGPLYAVTNVDALKDALDEARRHVRITEDNAAIERFRTARGILAPAPAADEHWDPSGYVPAARRECEP